MTLVESAPHGGPGGGAAGSQPGRRAASTSAGRQVSSAALITLAVTLLGFAAWLVFFSRLDYDRVQYNDYANFRSELAQATAPTGPTQPSNAKAPLTLG